MFESITIGPFGSPSAEVDAGLLAECLLFYGKVRVITGAVTFKNLVRVCGADELLELCDTGNLEITFLDNMTGIKSVETNLGVCHDLVLFKMVRMEFPQVARRVAEEEAGGSGRKANRLFSRLINTVDRSRYDEDVITGSQEDLKNRGYLELAVGKALSYLVPEYALPHPLIFRPESAPKFGTRYDTNIDFAAANVHYRKTVAASEATLNPAYLLAQITAAEPDIIIASRDNSEFAVDPLKSIIVSSRVSEIIRRSAGGKEEINAFSESIVGSRSVSEAVNSGERNFRDVIRLVDQAHKFKGWIQQNGEDSLLREEYCKSVSTIDWADRLPAKSIRFAVMTALSVLAGILLTPGVGIAGGIGLNAADYFLLDRLVKGWKPNQFVEGALNAFLTKG